MHGAARAVSRADKLAPSRERTYQQHASATLLLVHRGVFCVHSSKLKVFSSMLYEFLRFLHIFMFGEMQFMAV